MLFPSPCKIFIKIKGRSHSPNWQHSTSRRPGETKTNQESIETAYQVVEHISYDHMIIKRCDGRRRKILKSIKRWQRCQTSLTQFIPILFKGVSTFSQLPAIENLNRKIDIQYFDMPPENPFIHVFGRHFVTWNNEPRTSFTIHWRKPSSLLLASLYLYYTPNLTRDGNTEKYCQKSTFASVCQCHWSYRSSLQASALLPSHVLCRFLSFLPNHRLHLHLVLRSVTKLVRIIKTKNMMNAKNPKLCPRIIFEAIQ